MTDTITNTTEPDLALIEAFGEQFLGAYVGAATTAMVAIGHETGLFEAAATGDRVFVHLDLATLALRHGGHGTDRTPRSAATVTA